MDSDLTITRRIDPALFSDLTISRQIVSSLSSLIADLTITRNFAGANRLVLEFDDAPSGLVGTLTFSLVRDDDTIVIPATEEGISEVPAGSGRYEIEIAIPAPGTYFAVWDEPSFLEPFIARVLITAQDEGTLQPLLVPTSKTLYAHNFAIGTVVDVFPGEGQVVGLPPSGTPVGEAIVAVDGSLTFDNLALGRRFIAYAAQRAVAFRVNEYIDPRIVAEPAGKLRQQKTEQFVSAFRSDIQAVAADVATLAAARVQGTVTLVAGVAVVPTSAITAVTRVLLTGQDDLVAGALRVFARDPGVSFTVASSNIADYGVVAYELVEPPA